MHNDFDMDNRHLFEDTFGMDENSVTRVSLDEEIRIEAALMDIPAERVAVSMLDCLDEALQDLLTPDQISSIYKRSRFNYAEFRKKIGVKSHPINIWFETPR